MATTMITPGYVPLREAAREHAVSLRTLHRMLAEGVLTRYRQRGRREVLLRREELSKVLAPQPVPASA